jgi:hypothetical protein
MKEGSVRFEVNSSPADDQPTGTTIQLILKQTDGIARLFASSQSLKRLLFNMFASYFLRYEGEVEIYVDGERVDPSAYISRSDSELIQELGEIPSAELRHIVLSRFVEQEHPNILQFSTHGTTISSRAIDSEPIPGYKYLG